MFVNYLTLMLISVAAGEVFLAAYLWRGIEDDDQKRWALAFALPGLILLLTGLHMTLTWPLPGAYNIAFGEPALLFGILLLGAAWALIKGWDLLPVAAYGFFAGLATLFVSWSIVDYGMTRNPTLSGLAYALTGLAGVLAWPVLAFFRDNRTVRILGVLVLLAAAFLFAFTGYSAYHGHLAKEASGKWVPEIMRVPIPQK